MNTIDNLKVWKNSKSIKFKENEECKGTRLE